MADPQDQVKKEEGNEDGDEEEEQDETGYKAVKDAVLFAIDVSASMLQRPSPSQSSDSPVDASSTKPGDRDSATSAALKCAYSLMQQRIISNPNDMLGILLFGTEKSKFKDPERGRAGGNDGDGDANATAGNAQQMDTTSEYPHCFLLSDLDVPAAADVKRLRSMISDEEDDDEDSEAKSLLVPSTEPASMPNVLFCANQIFTTRASNFASRRLFLVTDNDNPHPSDKTLQQSSIIRAKDLYDLGVTIELFPISQPDHDFDTSKFYDDIVYRAPADPEAPAPLIKATKPAHSSSKTGGISLLTSLLTSIHSKSTPKRALFSNLPLELSPSLSISVKGYIIFKRQEPKRSCYVWLNGETPELAVGSTTRRAPEDENRRVEKQEVRKAFRFGGESVTFTPEELASLRNFGDPVIRILGFKPVSLLPLWATVRPSTFVYPSEEGYVGSTRTFSALQQTLLQKQKFALTWFIPRKNAAPTLAALLPGAEKVGETQGEQLQPPGLWISPLPFADDIRANPDISSEQKSIRPPDVLMDKLRLVVQQLHLPKGVYDPDRYPNPALQWHYRILQALALDEDLPDKPEDRTVPRHRQIHKRTGDLVVDWGESLQECYKQWQLENGASYSAPGKSGAGTKRGAGTSGASAFPPIAKKVKSETPDPSTAAGARRGSAASGTADAPTDSEVQSRINKGTLAKMNMAELKAWLKTKGLPVAGRKDDLVGRVGDWFG
ncbi:MAG: ATP-dependent DNA helicase II subunit 1 [Alyxoria varia]|nr:MAG: ATP-dependent DNA helicase II subunit 1 [Alyxoria varia]